jgi:hypothetical protein
MVYLALGAKEMFGGENRTSGWYYFRIVVATVVADGKVLVRDGRLALGPKASR